MGGNWHLNRFLFGYKGNEFWLILLWHLSLGFSSPSLHYIAFDFTFVASGACHSSLALWCVSKGRTSATLPLLQKTQALITCVKEVCALMSHVATGLWGRGFWWPYLFLVMSSSELKKGWDSRQMSMTCVLALFEFSWLQPSAVDWCLQGRVVGTYCNLSKWEGHTETVWGCAAST